MSGPLDAATTQEDAQAPDFDAYEHALQLRAPIFPRGTQARAKLEQLEEFMLLSAWYQGELNEQMVGLLEQGAPLQDEWDNLDGWQSFRQGRTDESVNQAKRTLRPDLWEEMQAIKRRVRALKNEIERLERDASKVSRAYTILSGG